MTAGFLAALCIYTRFIRKEVDQQLSLEVNKMVENYVNLAEKKKGSSGSNGSYSKMEEWYVFKETFLSFLFFKSDLHASKSPTSNLLIFLVHLV